MGQHSIQNEPIYSGGGAGSGEEGNYGEVRGFEQGMQMGQQHSIQNEPIYGGGAGSGDPTYEESPLPFIGEESSNTQSQDGYTQTDAYKNQAKTDAERKDWTNHLANQPGYVDQRRVAGGSLC